MDRLDAMKVFVAALDQGSLAGAGRVLTRSPAAVSRAIAFLESHVGSPLLHRNTRAMRLSDTGENYAKVCRRILVDLHEADQLATAERSTPHGLLTLSASPFDGEEILQPIVDAFLLAFPTVSVRLEFLDRQVNPVDDGVDLALRVGNLPDSALVAIKVASNVRRVIAATPRYLAQHPPINELADLARHKVVATAHFGLDSWSFPPTASSAIGRTVTFTPRIVVNSVRAAIASAMDGIGVTRLYDYQIADQIRANELRIVLAQAEHAPIPVNLVAQSSRLSVPKVRAFVDFALPRLRKTFSGKVTEGCVVRSQDAKGCEAA